MKRQPVVVYVSLFLLVSLGCQPDKNESEFKNRDSVNGPALNEVPPSQPQTEPQPVMSLLGKPLVSPPPDAALLAKLEQRKQDFAVDPENPDALIWYGRFLAYAGKYDQAIELYTQGIRQFPDDARILRHRGHRLISVRQFAKAIEDLEAAAKMIEGTENEIEPDGMPNAKNIPVSTLHGNIYYHLGLAYYLQQDFPRSLAAYQRCLATADKPDNVVSASHWLYMIHRRMGNPAAAEDVVANIDSQLDVIENMNYHQCCLFYKGDITREQLEQAAAEGAGRDAIDYAIANSYFYNNQREKARQAMEAMIKRPSWSSFGVIAAESDLANAFE